MLLALKSKNNFIYLLYCCLAFSACTSQPVHKWENESVEQSRQDRSRYRVTEVISGDTIRVEDGRIIKYLGVVAPRKGEPFFEKARLANSQLLSSRRVFLKFDDQYREDSEGRQLAYVFKPIKGLYCFVTKELLLFGYVRLANIPLTYRYAEQFLQMQKIAQREKRGIWGIGLQRKKQ